jgi:hypothetical protein
MSTISRFFAGGCWFLLASSHVETRGCSRLPAGCPQRPRTSCPAACSDVRLCRPTSAVENASARREPRGLLGGLYNPIWRARWNHAEGSLLSRSRMSSRPNNRTLRGVELANRVSRSVAEGAVALFTSQLGTSVAFGPLPQGPPTVSREVAQETSCLSSFDEACVGPA